MSRTGTLLLGLALLLGCAEGAPEGAGSPAAGGGAGPSVGPAPRSIEEGLHEVGCLACVFGDPDAPACRMAARVGAEVVPVEGEMLPKAPHDVGLCTASRRATIAGEIRGGVLHATKFVLAEQSE